jgi:hypothetical protein
VFNQVKFISLSLITALLCGCGGGGSAAAPATETSSSQLAASVKLTGYAGLSLAQAKVANGTQTASINKFLNWVTDAVFPKAYAQAATQCNYDLLKLAGVASDGTLEKLAVTTGADDCTTGFIDMYDGAKYILLTASGIYKDGLTCNLVLINKGDGNLYCVGERSRSIYKISGADSWKAYEKLQVSEDGNYMFLETDSTVFDQNGQITGIKTKLLRFDLSDDTKGPVATTLVEGFQKSWLSNAYTNGAIDQEYEGFTIKGYQGLNNGDLAMLYERSFSSPGNWSTKLNAFYYSFESDGSFERFKFDDNAINSSLTSAFNNHANAGNHTNSMNWYDISCFFKDPAANTSFIFTIPYSYWNGSNSGMYALILKGTKPTSGSTTMPVSVVYESSAICSESSGMGAAAAMASGSTGGTRPSKIGDTYYALQSRYGIDNNNSWTSKVYLVSNKFDGSADSSQLLSSSGTWWQGGRKLYASKDYLYLKSPSTGLAWASNIQPGDSLRRIDPTLTLLNGQGEIDATVHKEVITPNDYLSITKVASNKKDNLVKVTARDLADVDLSKIVGDIDEDGLFTRASAINKDLQPISIVKL